MLHKTRQFTSRYRLTFSNHLPLKRARHYLTSRLRAVRSEKPSAPVRAAIGLIRWSLLRTNYAEDRISSRAFCFITGRSRGTSRRYTVSRTRIKQFSSIGLLLGVRKSSW